MAGTTAPDPGRRARLYQGLALSMVFSAFFGGLILLDGGFSGRLFNDTERTVRETTGVIVALFWPCLVVMDVVRIRKSAARCRFEQRARLVEERRVERVHRLLQDRHGTR